MILDVVKALRDDNELNLSRLVAMVKGMSQ
jgi:hypothetical protein